MKPEICDSSSGTSFLMSEKIGSKQLVNIKHVIIAEIIVNNVFFIVNSVKLCNKTL